MTPVFQTKFYDETTNTVGNCIAACLASLFDVTLSEVPVFYPNDARQINDYKLKRFLASRGAEFIKVRNCSEHELPEGIGIDGYLMASTRVAKRPDYFHCVIWKDEQLVHDPRGSQRVELILPPTRFWDIRRK